LEKLLLNFMPVLNLIGAEPTVVKYQFKTHNS